MRCAGDVTHGSTCAVHRGLPARRVRRRGPGAAIRHRRDGAPAAAVADHRWPSAAASGLCAGRSGIPAFRPGRRGDRFGSPRENGAAWRCRARRAASNSSSSRSILLRNRSRSRRYRSRSCSARSRSRRSRSFSRCCRSSSVIRSSRDAVRQLARTRSLCHGSLRSTSRNCGARAAQMRGRRSRPAKQIHPGVGSQAGWPTHPKAKRRTDDGVNWWQTGRAFHRAPAQVKTARNG